VSVGALAAAGGVAAAVVFWPFSMDTRHSGRATGSAQSAGLPGGRIVAVDGTGSFVLSSPEGGRVTRPSALRNIGQPVSPSPDNHYLSLPNGQLVAVHQGPALAYLATKVANDGSTIAAWPDPFANHDRDEIMLRAYAGYESADNPVFVISLATGRSVPLGTADRVAGDPQTDGAFVSVAATTPSPSASATLTTADVRLELRQSARPGTLLATSVSLRADVGLGSSLPVALWPYPDPSGRTIAVVVEPVSGSQAGIVVLSRSGRELGSISASAGIRGFPAWSPSGGSLAFVSAGSSGPELHVWTMGGRRSAWKLPPGYGDDQCVWSPAGSAVICAPLAVADSQNWTAVKVAAGAPGRPVAVNGPGLPVAWLAGNGAR
jgi:hypothetical protein